MNTENMWNTPAEAIVLAGALHHPDEFYSINEYGLEVDDFGSRIHKSIFGVLSEVLDQHENPSMIEIIEALRAKGLGEAVTFIDRLMEMPTSVEQAKDKARIVKGLSISRKLERVGIKAIEAAREHRSEYEDALDEVEGEFAGIRRAMPSTATRTDLGSIIRDVRSSEGTTGIPIRFSPSLNYVTGGFIRGHLWVVGGFSSVGKSAVATNFILDVLADQDKRVMAVSTEMPKESYAIRLLSALSDVPQRNIRDRVALGSDTIHRIDDAEQRLSQANCRLYDNLYTLKGIRGAATRMKRLEGLDVLLVDFLQNIYITGDEVADARTAIIGLQELAKELDITVIVFSQISNDQAIRMTDNPNSDYYAFKGSGAIKDAADVAILLKRNQQDQSPVLECKVVKNRHEQLGKIIWRMTLETGRIEEINAEI